jgi:hypothetical protein
MKQQEWLTVAMLLRGDPDAVLTPSLGNVGSY